MKTTPYPRNGDFADARGKKARNKREPKLQPAETKSCTPAHTLSGCSGTETLALIERALMRLSSGTYGICLSCGADISVERLDDNPAVETCGTCRGNHQFKAH